MAIPIKSVRGAFGLLYQSILDRDFRKTLDLNRWSESELLPLVRTFLLGYFGHCYPEVSVRLAGAPSGWGRVDFLLGNVAVELAVRRPRDRKGPLSAQVNNSEMIKLMMYDGPSLLVLFDFSHHPFNQEDIQRFRNYPSLGRGNFKRSPFNVAYFYIKSARPVQCGCISKNIRIRSR
jgi:hypothetical protein